MEKKLLSILFLASLFFLNPVEGFGQCSDTNAPTVTITSNVTNNTICAGGSITFTASPLNVGSNPTYQWRINGVNQNGATNISFSPTNLQNGHVVTVVMNPNCSGTTAVTSNSIAVQVNAIPSAPTISGDNAVCAGDTISLNANTISGATYNWTGPGGFTFTGQNLSRSGASTNMSGTYTVTATVNGCTSNQGTYNVTVNSIPGAPTAGNGGEVCVGGSINLTAGNITGATFSWTGPNGFTSSAQNPIINNATLAMQGTYSVTATVNDCTSPAGTTNVVVNAAPTPPTAGNGGAVCVGSTIELTASNITGASYSWTGPGGFTSTDQNPTITGATTAMAGTYSVIATVNGCPSIAATTNVIVNTIPSAPTVSNNGPVCVGGTINLTATTVSGATYSWTGPNGFTSNVQNPTISNGTTAMAGEYSVTATVNGCTSNVATTTVVVNPIPSAPIASNGGAVCVGGTISLNATTIANATYSWTGPGGFTSTLQNPTRSGATTAMAGTYNVTATVNGCTSAMASTTIIVNTIPSAPTAGSNSLVCMNGTINLTASAITGATYAWTGPDGFTSSVQNPTISNLTAAKAGEYSVTATVNGCTSPAGTTSVTITPNVTPSVSITATSTAICSSAGTPVTFTATPTNGGTTPTYQWRRNGSPITGATSSTYTVNSLPNPSTISVVMTSNVSCALPATATSNGIAMNVYTSIPSTGNGQNAANRPSGPNSVCPGPAANNLKYTIPTNMTQNAEYYTWHLPPGFNIVAGAGTREITVSVPGAGAVSGTNEISVTAFNPCGNSGRSTPLVVTVGSFAAVDVGPDKTICLETNITLINTLSGSANDVTWAIVNGTGTISGGPYPEPFVYTPSSAGTATLRATTNTATGSCSSSTGIDNIIITTNQPPAITTQPIASQTICSGTPANFNVAATGTGLTYQWQKDGTNISGATSSTYEISSPTTGDSGEYSVIVTGLNPCSSVTSDISNLVVNEIIAIEEQPVASQTLCSGSNTTLSVSATGTGLTYQWKKNSTDIAGANSSTLTLNDLTTDDSGEYTVLITGTSPCEPLLSDKAIVTVNEVVAITEQPAPSQTLCSGSTANFSVTATGTGLTYQWKKDGTNIPGETSVTLTLNDVTTEDSGNYTVEVTGTDPCQPVTTNVAALVVNEIINISDQPATLQTLCSGSTANFSVTATGTGLTYQWKKNGINIAGETSSSLSIENVSTEDSGNYTVEISGTDPCEPVLSEIAELVVNEIVTITEQPTPSQTLCVGSTANFSVAATGTGLTYQWKKDGTNISNETSATLSISQISTSDAGEYTVLITGTDPCEPILSATAILIVDELTVITKDLEYTEPVSVCAGFPFSFEIEASGTDISYEWFRGSTSIGNNSPTLSLSQASSTNAGTYTVKVTGACGEITSQPVVLIVNQSLTITTQPEPTYPVCLGENSIEISVAATGDIYDYVWRKDGIPVADGSKYAGSNSATLTINDLANNDSGNYDVVISSPEGSCSQIISTPSVVTVYDPPTADAGPDFEVCSTETTIALSGATATNHTSVIWSTTGAGQINNATDLSGATYSPVAADHGETLIFTLTSILEVNGDPLCEDAVDTRGITIIPQPVITEFSYISYNNTALSGAFCETDNTIYIPFTDGDNLANGSGAFTVSSNALAVNPATGEFNPNGTTPGTYVITYTYTAGSENGSCTLATKEFTVNITEQPVAAFSYENTPFCSDAENPTPSMNADAVKGTFSSTAGLVFVDAATGEINIAGSTPGTYTVINTIAAANGCAIVTASAEITINQKPAVLEVSDVAYCLNDENVPALTVSPDTGATLNWYGSVDATIALGAAPQPNTATAAVTTYWVSQTSAAGCESERSAITVTVNPLPVVTASVTQNIICLGSTAQLTGTGGATYIWYDGTNVIGNEASISHIPAAAGEYTYRVVVTDANGCENSAEVDVQVDENTVAGTLTGPDSVCVTSPAGTLTLSGNTGAVQRWEKSENGGTSWTPIAATTNTYQFSNLTVPTTFRAVVKSGVCEELFSNSVDVIIDPIPVGGELAFGEFGRMFITCESPQASTLVNLELTGITGQIAQWEYKPASQNTWVTITEGTENYTEALLTAVKIASLNLQETTAFRVKIVSGACAAFAYSQTGILSIISSDIEPTPVTVDKDVICIDESVTLSASTGYESGEGIGDSGNFDNASITNHGWRVQKNGVDQGFSTSASNIRPDIWLRVTPREFITANINTNATSLQLFDPGIDDGNKGFAIVSGNNPSTMETPVFRITDMDQAVLQFDQAYNLTAGATISVEISINGGATYETVLFSVTGPASSGNYASFGTGTLETRPLNKMQIDLGNYLGMGNLRIRFNYIGVRDGDLWTLDGITFPEGPANIGTVWKDYTQDPENPSVIGTNPTEIWKPTQIGWNSSVIITTLEYSNGSCETAVNSEEIKVFAFDNWTTSVQAVYGSCGNYTAQLSATATGAVTGITPTYPTPDGYMGRWVITGGEFQLTSIDATYSGDVINNPNVTITADDLVTLEVSWELFATARNEDNVIISNPGCNPVPTPLEVLFTPCTALDFDGDDDYVDLGLNYTGTGYSFEAWVKPASSGGTIISGPQFNITAPAGLSTTRWTHIAVSGGTIYLDGIASGSPSSGNGVGVDKTLIGARWDGSEAKDFFHGYIEELRIWNGTISPENIRFTMNQRLKAGERIGEEIDMVHPDAPSFANLAGYYRLISAEPDPIGLVQHAPELLPINGTTIDLATNSVPGVLKNMTTNQQNTAPLPYITGLNGNWDTASTWARPSVWQIPNTASTNWNIVRTLHDVNATRAVSVLGLISEAGTLDMVGTIPAGESHLGVGTGNALTISHYLKLDGIIDLNGESQLLQPELSIVDPASSGHLDRDQQGKRNSFIYNYWSSPVSATGFSNNGGYTVGGVLLDGTNPAAPAGINFQAYHGAADGTRSVPITISAYWLWKFSPATANAYSEWEHIGSTESVNSGEGFTMKGTAGNAGMTDGQNYTFRGKPHNGNISLPNLSVNQNYLIGNPYPSAIDAHEFIRDNLENVVGGKNDRNVFDGSLYFWDHFQEVNHILKEYIGGYAVLNLGGAVPAASVDDRINNTGNRESTKTPGRFIPVAQGFMINSTNVESSVPITGGNVQFKNSQRSFVIEGTSSSIFLKPETGEKTTKSKESDFKKIRLSFSSPIGYWRQILVGAVPGTTDGFDLGYDAHLFDDNVEDIYWVQGSNNLVIQGVPDFGKDRVLKLGVKIKENKDFTIRIDTVENATKELKIYLKDNLNDSIHDIRKGHYVSRSEPGTFNDRFEIIFYKDEPVPPVVEVPDEVDENDEIYKEFGIIIRHGQTDRELQILNPHELSITNMYIFDLNGNRLEAHGNLPGDKEFRMPVRNYSSGIYIVQLVVEGRVVSKKIMINN